MSSTKLYITRHGETNWNVQERMQGWKDSSLTELGMCQAKSLCERLKDVEFDTVYSSPTGRAFKTAEIVRGNRKIHIIKSNDLREIFLGSWEGLTRKEIDEVYGDQFYNFWNLPHLYEPNHGETFEQVRERTFSFAKNVVKKHEGNNVLLVTHTMALKSLMSCIEGKPVEKIWDPPFIKQTSLTIVEVENDKWDIVVNADTSHLKDLGSITTVTSV